VSALVTSANGYAVFTVKPTRSSTYRVSYRARYAGGFDLRARTVTVHQPAPGSHAAPSRRTSDRRRGQGRGAQVVAAAAAQTGKPYSYGAAGPGSFDCSGLTLYAFRPSN